MWRPRQRPRTEPSDAAGADAAQSGDGFGVGVQVHVIDDERQGTLGWVGDPTGVIIASATGLANGAFEVQRLSGRVWVVAFDEPQYRVDGAGPFDRAEVPEFLLVTAPIADGLGETADDSVETAEDEQ